MLSSSSPTPPTPPTIDGVVVQGLTWHSDQRGSLCELVRDDDPVLVGPDRPIRQVYTTTLYPGVVKGWHLHSRQWDRMVCLVGRVMLGLVDGREGSPTKGATMSVVMGDRNPVVVLVPAGVYHGLKNIGVVEAMVVNVVSATYDRENPDEVRVAPHGVLDFQWERVDQ